MGLSLPTTRPDDPAAAAAATPQNGTLLEQLTGNPFFTAGFGLAALAATARFGQRGIKQGADLLRRLRIPSRL